MFHDGQAIRHIQFVRAYTTLLCYCCEHMGPAKTEELEEAIYNFVLPT